MRKKILSAVLAMTMVMTVPMTAMAAQKPLPVGEWTGYARSASDGRYTATLNYEVLDAGSFWGTTNQAGLPYASDIHMKTLQGALNGLAATHDIYYVRVAKQESWGTGYGDNVLGHGALVDGQRFEYNDTAPGVTVHVDENGKWYTEEERLALGYIPPAVSGKRWSVTVNGQPSQVVYFQSMAGLIWAVPKSASNVRLLFGQRVDTEGVAELNGASWGRWDWDNAYYIDLKTGTNIASVQPQTTGASPMWKQNAKGWWLERPDGSYLQNEWYLYNNQWYYMGADGYMLTNTTTPDGYTVNADGVRVE